MIIYNCVKKYKLECEGCSWKKQLDAKKLLKIKESVFQIYPCESGESQHSAWITCCKAIDESGRRLNRIKGKENMPL